MRSTDSKAEADSWVATPTGEQNTMNVYGYADPIPFVINCPNCRNCHPTKEEMAECLMKPE